MKLKILLTVYFILLLIVQNLDAQIMAEKTTVKYYPSENWDYRKWYCKIENSIGEITTWNRILRVNQ